MLLVAYASAGQSLDFFAYNAAGRVWDGAAYVSPPASGTSPAAFRIAATEGPAFRYTATAPAGCYGWDLRVRASTWAASTPVDGTPGVNVAAVNGAAFDPADSAPRDVTETQRYVLENQE